MRIELHIERLVIDEALLGGERSSAVCVAIEQQLGRAMTAPGTFAALRDIGSVANLPPAMLAPASHPNDRLGSRIAIAVQRGLGVSSTAAQRGPGAGR
ncbi:MAG: hypothetical protein ABI128_10180 [Rhodanobacter sp.]